MKNKTFTFYICLLVLALCGWQEIGAQQKQPLSGLNAKQFNKYWRVESESPDYRVTFRGDTAEILSPKGLTLWRKEKMSGKVTIEYDACVVVEKEGDRLSDLNCFWMASDPQSPDNLWKRAKWRSGIFLHCYTLQLYYLGYGGNHNSTTRFRRYDGDEAGVTDKDKRPAILTEYTDKENLLKPNHWYHIKITNENNRVCYYIDGKRLVDFRDPNPLTEGWFGFRTTLSRTRITNFRYHCEPLQAGQVPLQWIGEAPGAAKPVSFGVPFSKGYLRADEALVMKDGRGEAIATDNWPLAYWPDGSVKWSGVASVVPAGATGITLQKAVGKKMKTEQPSRISVSEDANRIVINTGNLTAYIPKSGGNLIDSLLRGGMKVGGNARLVCRTQSEPLSESTKQLTFHDYAGYLQKASIEQSGKVRATVKLEGVHRGQDGREWLPFVVRLYFYAGSEQVKMVHSFVYDGDQNKDFIRALGIRFEVPMREALYNRHVAFSCADGGVWSEPVQPLVGRRVLTLNKPGEDPQNDRQELLQQQQMEGMRIPEYEAFDKVNQNLIDNWASWDGYRLSQSNADAFTIRKRANANNPWIGTFSGTRSNGYAFVGDISGGLGIRMHDFWQSHPSALEVSGAKDNTAELTAWIWSPDAEAMDLRHYDNVAHDLNASYEDVQEGLSTPYGIARTLTFTLIAEEGYHGKEAFGRQADEFSKSEMLMAAPEYLHAQRAFGVWSLPDSTTPFRAAVEQRLEGYIDHYRNAIEQHKWYGFWNYGDVMHAYDPVRHSWRYDIGGYAWDNTELASNMWIWYNFLRTGRADIWRMAEAITRHTCEVDVYHVGPNAGLGSRHNVSHWGCGAKEGRISQAAWNRYYYYLTTDERCGDLMTAVKDAEQKLYTLDPMRLAQPRELYPCTAPARLRIGPDWISYAGNWMTEWERTQNSLYRDKILAGIKSICKLPNRIVTGPAALGFDPATGIITTECDPTLLNTNHLVTIMGGFEVMNEMMAMIDLPEWKDAWLDYALNYRKQTKFRNSRLTGYAAYQTMDKALAEEAWRALLQRKENGQPQPLEVTTVMPPYVPAPMEEAQGISTNGVATWSLDAIYLQEVAPMND